LEAGATGIELDVHATADRHLVVSHDATVDRTTAGTGNIAELTLARLEELDPGYWFIPGADVTPGSPDGDYPYRGRAAGDPDFRFATLRSVLELLADHPGVALNLDIKQTAPVVEPYEEDLARLLAEFGGTDRVIVASFLDPATEAFARYAPDVATSAGTTAVAAFYQAVRAGEDPAPMDHVALQVPARMGDLVIVDQAFVDAAHRDGLAVHVWTINDEEEMARLLGLEVDGIISDLPTTLVGLLEAKGRSYRP
jgi:glycerophosphoryl diester phosphodiesterase